MPIVDLPTISTSLKLYVVPYYGYGWAWFKQRQAQDNPLGVLWPDPFWLIDCELIYLNNEIVGVCGKIGERHHEYNGSYATCCLRFTETANLRETCPECSIYISKERLKINPIPKEAIFNWIPREAEMLAGYGTLALDPKFVEKRIAVAKASKDELLRNRPQ